MEPNIIKRLKEYFSSQPVKRAWLFGSVARQENNDYSDVDILVDFDDNVGLLKYASINNDLETILNKAVDLVSISSLLSWVKPSVDKDKVLIYEREA